MKLLCLKNGMKININKNAELKITNDVWEIKDIEGNTWAFPSGEVSYYFCGSEKSYFFLEEKQ
jgi:hypothetical protein